MQQGKIKLTALVASVCLAGVLALSACSSSGQTQSQTSESTASSTSTAQVSTEVKSYPVSITDRMGRTVTVNSGNRIATLCATGYDRMLVLGAADRVVGNFGTLTDWAKYVNGGVDVTNLGGGNVAANPDVEALNALDIDVLYCWQEAIEAGNVTDPGKANFTAICSQLSKGNPTTVDEFKAYLTSEIYLYSDALDDAQAAARADKWVNYMNEKIDYVTEKTSTLSSDQLTRVYYARGGKSGSDPLNGFLKYSYPDFAIQIAGGVNVADEAESESYGDVTAEQIAVWNPQVIFCGRIADTAAVTGNAAFTATDAVKDGKVYTSPAGVMEWDTGSECVLNILYVAKTLHPDLFTDLDMVAEVQEYYSTFYDTTLTSAQAQNILNHMGPTA